MNPVVLIATHQRTEITSRNIEMLQSQSRTPEIVLVCSDVSECDFYTRKFPTVHVLEYRNKPLGAKWQFGASKSKVLNPDPLIILGSDDLLGKYFIRNICAEIERGYDFVGLNRWWLHSEGQNTVFLLQYTVPNFPLGGGRAYSKKILEKLNYKVFDASKDKSLDDFGWHQSKKHGAKTLLISDCEKYGMNIISIKGDWITMNSADRLLNAKSVKTIKIFDKSKLKELL